MTRPTPKPKKPSRERPAKYNEGGGSNEMLGKGDRIKVAVQDSAGPQTAGVTSSKAKANPPSPKGGSKPQAVEEGEGKTQRVRVAGGLAYPAMAGATGTGTEVIPEGEQHWRRGKRI
jgi:hypothetical protein